MPGPGRIELDARLAAIGLGLLLALGASVVALGLALRATDDGGPRDELRRDPELRRSVVAELAREAVGNYDSHPDAEVGHVHLLGERDGFHGKERVNAFGMREKDYVLPKPAGLVRIVMLGDSFVFGWRVAAEQRMGALIEELLREHGAGAVPLEVLHLGVCSWGLVSECAFLRRQLEELQPDLVVQFTVMNDLDDPQGVRGFGALADFPTLGLGPGNALVHWSFSDVFERGRNNLLPDGWGFESRSRFERARHALASLRADLERLPARHLLVVHWDRGNRVFHEHVGRSFEREALLYLPVSFEERKEYRLEGDRHWSPEGHRAVARACYATIRERNLLPRLTLEPWPEAEQEARALAEEGWTEAQVPPRPPRDLDAAIEPRRIVRRNSRQVLGGVAPDGLVAPYASILLGNAAATELAVTGRFLPDAVLAGASVTVCLDEIEVGRLAIAPGEPIAFQAALPAALRDRAAISARFLANEFVYRGPDLRRCVVFELERVELR